jgi:molybdopterin-biosynthesis enzyme MoeA-like protein
MCEQLQKYCDDNDISDPQGAAGTGVNRETFRLHRKGLSRPGGDNMMSVCAWTGFVVQPNHFYGLPGVPPEVAKAVYKELLELSQTSARCDSAGGAEKSV